MGKPNRRELAEQMALAAESGDATGALALARLNGAEPRTLDVFSYNSSGVLIDFGSAVHDRSDIELGMSIAEDFIQADRLPMDIRVQARYNLSNGHAALALEAERQGDVDGRRQHWEAQRDQLQILALEPGSIPLFLRTEVFTNFGNVLDELGRTVEAFDMYRRVLSIDPDHPIAAGSAGQLLLRWMNIQPHHNVRILFAARTLLKKALTDKNAIRAHTSEFAAESYQNALQQSTKFVEMLFKGGVREFESHVELLRFTHPEWKSNTALAYWAQEGLLLTVNPFPEWCPSTLADDIFFDGLITSPDKAGEDRFEILAKTLNQIKEDFALARYSLLLSENPEVYRDLSAATKFADTLDYADFGLASGLLKSAMRQAVDIFDKVANFLNRYLELGIPDRRVSFASVWYEKGILDSKKRIDHPTMVRHLSSTNWLRGIRDVAETLNLYPAPSKEVRNKATHDFLVIQNLTHPVVTLHGQTFQVDAHEYARLLLLMAKGVIVNLVAIVQREEGQKRPPPGKIHAPLEFRYARGLTDELASDSDEPLAD